MDAPACWFGAGSVALDKLGSLLKPDCAFASLRQRRRRRSADWQRREGSNGYSGRSNSPTSTAIYLVIAAQLRRRQLRCVSGRGRARHPVQQRGRHSNCDFFFGSVVSRGELQIAISTAGESPAVAQRLRREIDEQLPEDLGPWLENLGRSRREVLAAHPRTEHADCCSINWRKRPVCESASCPSRQIALAPIDKQNANSRGKVHLVGAGPGDPDLLTVKALRLIQSADVLLHDDLVPNAILDLARSGCEVVNVGKRCGVKNVTQEEINALMAEHARAHRRVVRLKSGDPLIFGRAAEEIAALTEAGIPF